MSQSRSLTIHHLLFLLPLLFISVSLAISPEGRLFATLSPFIIPSGAILTAVVFRFVPKPPTNLDTGSSSFDRAQDFIVEARQRLTTAAQVTAVSLLESYAVEQGNICDLGNLATVCVIERSKLWNESSVTISSRGAGHDSVASVPFTAQVK
jgi:hypothetical protein